MAHMSACVCTMPYLAAMRQSGRGQEHEENTGAEAAGGWRLAAEAAAKGLRDTLNRETRLRRLAVSPTLHGAAWLLPRLHTVWLPLSSRERGLGGEVSSPSIDERDPGADVDIAVVHFAPAAAVPVEVHL